MSGCCNVKHKLCSDGLWGIAIHKRSPPFLGLDGWDVLSVSIKKSTRVSPTLYPLITGVLQARFCVHLFWWLLTSSQSFPNRNPAVSVHVRVHKRKSQKVTGLLRNKWPVCQARLSFKPHMAQGYIQWMIGLGNWSIRLGHCRPVTNEIHFILVIANFSKIQVLFIWICWNSNMYIGELLVLP